MFISTNELEKINQNDSVLVLDARSYKDYSNGHIPGSVSLDLFSFHWSDTSEKGIVSFGEHMRKILSYAGIDENKKIIFYDDVTGMLAARGVWICLYFSHPDVQMLNGGYSKWSTENLPIQTESIIYKPSKLSTPTDPSILIGFGLISFVGQKTQFVLVGNSNNTNIKQAHSINNLSKTFNLQVP